MSGLEFSYFQLLASAPIYIPKVGGILSPTLQDVADIGGDTVYQYYLNILLVDAEQLFSMANKSDDYNSMSDEERFALNVFDIFVGDDRLISLLETSLNFFIKEDVLFSKEYGVFEVKTNVVIKSNDGNEDKYTTIGLIDRENFADVVSVICKRNNIKTKELHDVKKVKSKKALAILEKLKKGREAKTVKADKDMDLGNIISAVANKSQSLNIVNIWDLTIYQLWDCFARVNNNNAYDINAASVSAWGDKDKKFDFGGWYRRLTD